MSWRVIERDGKRHRIAVAADSRGVWVGWPGGARLIPAAGSPSAQTDGDEATDDVRAPLTGKVIEVRVAPGDAVTADDLLVVLEAMKMEYRLTAPRDGVIGSVACAEGELVDQGTSLIQFKA